MIAAIYARILIVTLGLLALTTSASAECAWVLWQRVDTFDSRGDARRITDRCWRYLHDSGRVHHRNRRT